MKYEYWKVPQAVITQTERALLIGAHEVFVLWTADLEASGPTCDVRRCVIPTQKPGVSRYGGVYVHIEGTELSNIQLTNYERRERSVIQLHTHPGADVTMSGLDREWEVVCHVGALSIIVPEYGRRGLKDFSGVNVYEREESDWRLWSTSEMRQRIQLV